MSNRASVGVCGKLGRLLASPQTILLFGLLVFVGCAGDSDTAIDPPAPLPASTEPGIAVLQEAGPTVTSESPELELGQAEVVNEKIQISISTWEEIAANVKEAGKPAVVDVWSLACEPCMKEFPGLVKLDDQYGEQLNCVSVNVDFDGRRTHPPESYSSDVKRFLNFNNAEFENYICATPSDMVFETLDIVSIPAVLLFDASGNEVARFVDAGETRGFTYEKNVAPALAKLLGDAGQADTLESVPAEDAAPDAGTP